MQDILKSYKDLYKGPEDIAINSLSVYYKSILMAILINIKKYNLDYCYFGKVNLLM